MSLLLLLLLLNRYCFMKPYNCVSSSSSSRCAGSTYSFLSLSLSLSLSLCIYIYIYIYTFIGFYYPLLLISSLKSPSVCTVLMNGIFFCWSANTGKSMSWSPYDNITYDWLGFFVLRVYQPSWVILCQSYTCKRILVIFNPYLGVYGGSKLSQGN